MTLGQKLKKLRMGKGLTQKELADQLHVTFQTVSKWENNENEPDIQTLRELAKLYSTSVDYLISEEEKEPTKVEEENEEVEQDEPQVTKTIVIHQKELHVCEHCKKDIPENDLAMQQLCVRPGGRGHAAEYRMAYYHKNCLAKVKADLATQAANHADYQMRRSRRLSFIWSIVGGVAAFGITLAILLGLYSKEINPGVSVAISFGVSYAIFAMIYCILAGSFIASVFGTIASWSIHFPGLIFTWDIEGFIWVIAMKILFMILGALISLFALIFAVMFAGSLSMFAFPFILVLSIKNGYKDSMFYKERKFEL